MSQITTLKLNFTIKSDKFDDLISKLEDLSKIGDVLKFKMDNEDTLIYSMVGENMILAFKNYVIKTKDYFQLNEEIDNTLDMIIPMSKKFVKNLGLIK